VVSKLWFIGAGLGFDDDLDIFALSETIFLAVLVRHNVFDANFFVQLIGFMDLNFDLFRFAGENRLDS
jgi:hypothetical protein